MREAKRARRRRLTETIAARRRALHRSVAHPDGVSAGGGCVCERGGTYFAKRAALGCDCRRRKRGQPKRGSGCCWGFVLRRAVRERIDAKRLCAAVLAGRRGPDEVPVGR